MNLLTILARAFSLWPAGDSIAVISQNRVGELLVCTPHSHVGAPLPIAQGDAGPALGKPRRPHQAEGWTHWERLYFAANASFPLEVAGDWSTAIVTKDDWLAKRAELFPNKLMPEPDQPKPAAIVNLMDPMSIKQGIHDAQARIAKLHEQLNREKDLCSDYFRALGELGFTLTKGSVQPPM